MRYLTRSSQVITASRYFVEMLFRPARTIPRISSEPPAFWALALFLTLISLLRAVLDGVVVLLDEQQLIGMWLSGRLLPWFLFKAYPLLLADWLAVYVRWLGFALVPYILGRLCGGQGQLKTLLRLYGVILGIYVVTPLPNFAYFLMPLPQIRFAAAPGFMPVLGIGNVATSVWLAWVTYLVVRQVHRLPRFEAVGIGVITPLLNIAALVLPGALIFNLPTATDWHANRVDSITLLGFSLISVMLIGAAIGLIRWLLQRERAPIEPAADQYTAQTSDHPGANSLPGPNSLQA